MWGYGETNRICHKNDLSSPAGEMARRKPRLRGCFASLKATNICRRGGYYLTAKFVVTYCLVFCRVRRLDAPLTRERHEILKMSIATVRGDSPCGCPLSAKPIQRFKQADKPRFLNFCKVKASDSTNIYNQASNSRAAVFDKPTKRGEGTACAASRTSTHPFKLRRVCGRMCRAAY